MVGGESEKPPTQRPKSKKDKVSFILPFMGSE